VSLVARYLEAHGIPTVVFGCARDIVEHAGVPRFVFCDFPLGNPCGRPFDAAMQRHVVGLGLDLLAGATAPRTTLVAPYAWGDDTWKEKCFTPERPFLDEAATARWLERKQAYRDLKSTGSA
jgi:D-proline reductase (dithiol) PrdB